MTWPATPSVCALAFVFTFQIAAGKETTTLSWWEIFEMPLELRLQALADGHAKEAWPRVRSLRAIHCNPDGEWNMEADFSHNISAICDDIRAHYNTRIKQMPAAEFEGTLGRLIGLRDIVLKEPSFSNYILADEINRVCAAALISRLVGSGTNAAAFSNLVGALIGSPMSVEGLKYIVGLEGVPDEKIRFSDNVERDLDQARRSIARACGENVANEVDAYRRLYLSVAGERSSIIIPSNIMASASSDLVKSGDVPVFLWRLTLTEVYLHDIIPAIMEWEMKRPTGARPEYEIIKETLIPSRSDSWAAIVMGLRNRAERVEDIFLKIDQERLDEMILLQRRDRGRAEGSNLKK